MVFFEHENRSRLVVGMGGMESVLTFVDERERSYHSLGDRYRTGTMAFLCRGQRDDFLQEMAVPEPLAIEAALEFLETGTRPSGIEWEADW